MRFDFDEGQHAFKQEVCAFLREQLTPELVRAHGNPKELSGYDREFVLAFRQAMAERSYIGVGWPTPEGDMTDVVLQVILQEEMEYHGAPQLSAAYTYVPPALLLFGTEAQQEQFLPRIRAGEIDITVGYTESQAGSDLANLQCRAVLDGDEFVVNGQKLYSSDANYADYAWLAVRTDAEVAKHRGISLLLVDMASPGITIDRYVTMGGWEHHGIQFDDVRVPGDMLVGELNHGWYHIMAGIDIERLSNASPGHVMRLYDHLLTDCEHLLRNGRPLLDDPSIARSLAELAADVEIARLCAYWVASLFAASSVPQHESALVTLAMRETARKISTKHLEVLGAYGQLSAGSKWVPQQGAGEFHYLNDMYYSFAAGGFDITRNIIAKRGLGLS